MQKGGSPTTDAINLNSSRSNIYRVKATHVSVTDKTFTVEIPFSAKNLKGPFPEVGKIYDITYTETTSGGALEVTTIKSATGGTNLARNSENGTMTSYRVANPPKVVTGKVTKVDAGNKTFTAEVTLSAKNLTSPLPEVGRSYDITFQTTPGGPPVAMKADMSSDTHNPAP
jgi:hypothetical protein